MSHLLSAAAAQGMMPGYLEKLLVASGDFRLQIADFRLKHQQSAIHNLQSAMVEPLSERELDVLRLLGTDLSGPDIARELMVSLNTLRTHTKNIYAKLGVNNRRAAVHRAKELKLL